MLHDSALFKHKSRVKVLLFENNTIVLRLSRPFIEILNITASCGCYGSSFLRVKV